MEIIIGITIWLVLGVINYAGTFAYFQRKYPNIAREGYSQDMRFAIIINIFPVIPALVGFFYTGFYKYGFKFY